MTQTPVPDVPAAADSDVFITRAFAAPRDVVWRFFTEPGHLARWFGPAGVHVDRSSVVVEATAGGSWDLDMVDDETAERFPIRTRLTVVIPPEYLEGTLDGPPGSVTLRIWLHDHGDTTRLTLHQGPFAPEFLTPTVDGWQSSFDKIDALLEETR